LAFSQNLWRRHRSRLWQILGYRILGRDSLFKLRCVRWLHVLPSLLDNRVGNTSLNRRRLRCYRLKRRRRRDDVQLVPLEGLAVVRIRTSGRIYRELNLLNILMGLRRNRLNLRTIVINYGVIVNDVRNVLRLADNLHVLGRRLYILCVTRRRPMRVPNECVSSGSDIIIRVRP
jgi:hypothetical protein